MIPSDLLDQIREKDPEIHSRYVNLMQDIDPLCEGDIPFCQNAIMQACLQEAIRARGWHLYQIRNDDLPGLPCFADIIILGHGKEHDIHHEGEGDTEAEALLMAYLQAIGD